MSAISPPQSSRSKEKYTNLCYTEPGLTKPATHKKTVHENNEQTFTKDAENTKNHSLAKLQNAKKFSDEIKDAKKMKKHKLRVFQYTDDDQKKYLKK
jgi:hypothetical protein